MQRKNKYNNTKKNVQHIKIQLNILVTTKYIHKYNDLKNTLYSHRI
jgi:hypothetical protein